MNTEKKINERIAEIRSRSSVYEKRFSNKMNELNKMTNYTNLLNKVKEGTMQILSDKRTLYIAGGVFLSFFIIKAFIPRKKKYAADLHDLEGIEPMQRERSFIYELIMMSIQTFILQYARKLLQDYLDKQSSSDIKIEETVD